MQLIRNLLRRPRRLQGLLLRAVLPLIAAVLALRVWPLARVLGWVGAPAVAVPRYTSAEIAEAVAAAGRHVPGANCLPQALACWWLLRRNGLDGELRIGTRMTSDGLAAHAWLESGGQVIIGGAESSSEYVPFAQLRTP